MFFCSVLYGKFLIYQTSLDEFLSDKSDKPIVFEVFTQKDIDDITKEEFMNGYLDKKQCFEPDPVLMEQILNMFDEHCTSN